MTKIFKRFILIDLALFALCLVSCSEREISSTLICKDSSYLDGTEFKYTYLIDIDLNNQKVYVKETSFNPFYSEEENKALDEAELYHLIEEEYVVEKGNKVAQMLIQSVEQREVMEVSELDETDRGEGGFGSTGIN